MKKQKKGGHRLAEVLNREGCGGAEELHAATSLGLERQAGRQAGRHITGAGKFLPCRAPPLDL